MHNKVAHMVFHAVKHTALHVIIPNVLRLLVLPAVAAGLAVFGMHVDPTEMFGALTGEGGHEVAHTASKGCEWLRLDLV